MRIVVYLRIPPFSSLASGQLPQQRGLLDPGPAQQVVAPQHLFFIFISFHFTALTGMC